MFPINFALLDGNQAEKSQSFSESAKSPKLFYHRAGVSSNIPRASRPPSYSTKEGERSPSETKRAGGEANKNLRTNGLTENKSVKAPIKFEDQGQHLCELHNKKIEAYCKVDFDLVCIDCILSENHKDHKLVSIQKAVSICSNFQISFE